MQLLEIKMPHESCSKNPRTLACYPMVAYGERGHRLVVLPKRVALVAQLCCSQDVGNKVRTVIAEPESLLADTDLASLPCEQESTRDDISRRRWTDAGPLEWV